MPTFLTDPILRAVDLFRTGYHALDRVPFLIDEPQRFSGS